MAGYTSTTLVYTNASFIGFHHWPTAPGAVSYLRSPHRHEFNIYVAIDVQHDDREVEFHMLKRNMLSWLRTEFSLQRWGDEIDLGSTSCEGLAKFLLEAAKREYPDRAFYRADVDEDGENGASVEETREWQPTSDLSS